MKKRMVVCFIFVLVFTVWAVTSFAQSCLGVTFKEGSGYEMANYDGKGKLTATTIYKIKGVTSEGGYTVIDMDFESLDKKGKSEMKSTYKMRCNGNELLIDANSFLGPEQRKSFESFEMKFTSKDLVFPAKYTVGQTLRDGSLHGEGSSGPIAADLDMLISNRKVVAQEKVTTPAGTFDAYKVTSTMNISTKTFMKMSFDFETISYRAAGILWDVKSETYRKGKLMGSSELTKIF